MERYTRKIKEKEMNDAFDFVFKNAFGLPIRFDSAPSLNEMKANTWGYNGTTIYIKFGNSTGISITGTALS